MKTTTVIKVRVNTLTDGSETFDVLLSDGDSRIELVAYTERDATALADKLLNAIEKHALGRVDWVI